MAEKRWRKGCAAIPFLWVPPSKSRMRSHLLSPRYSCYNVPCAFKCAKHHVCLAGPSAPRWGRDRLCFLSYGDFAFVPPSPPRWLAEWVGKQSHPVCRCLYIFCTQEARCTFFPLHGKRRGKADVQSSVREAVSPAAEPPCSRQAAPALPLETAKRRK